MRIAVNTRFLLKDYLEGYGYFLYEVFLRLTKQHPEHEFIFIFDRAYDPSFIFSPNIKAVVTGPPARHPLLWKLWYDIKIPSVLKKYKADVFVSCDGFCSLTTSIPQCLVIHDLSFLHYPTFIPASHLSFYKRYTPKFIAKAKSIVTVSEFSKKDIITQYQSSPEKIHVVYNAAKEVFKPMDSERKKEIREKFTGGTEYFLYAGSIHPRKNLINLLKAFSVFKKKQQSSWKLVLAGRLAWKYQTFMEALKTYKYRDDVVLTGYLPTNELADLMGAAYALVYPSVWEGFGVPVLEAMQTGVPVITSEASAMKEIANHAALYADPNSYNAIAECMQLLYKDESLRSKLIAEGLSISRRFTWEQSANEMWNCILKAIH